MRWRDIPEVYSMRYVWYDWNSTEPGLVGLELDWQPVAAECCARMHYCLRCRQGSPQRVLFLPAISSKFIDLFC